MSVETNVPPWPNVAPQSTRPGRQGDKSWVTGDCYAQICEGREVKPLPATRPQSRRTPGGHTTETGTPFSCAYCTTSAVPP